MSIRDLLEDVGPSDDNPMRRAQAAMRPVPPKRFYGSVTVAREGGAFGVRLDGKPVKTPRGRSLAVPAAAIAEALAAEWQAQAEHVDPASMPLTRLVNVTLDAVIPEPRPTIDEIVHYAGSDLVCYRAGEPARLVELQSAAWDPALAFARDALGARFVLSQGIVHVAQPEAAIVAVRRAVEAVPPLGLGALYTLVALSGSALIGLAVARARLAAEAGWAAAHVDEDYQAGLWGEDAEALARRAARKLEWDAAVRLILAFAEGR